MTVLRNPSQKEILEAQVDIFSPEHGVDISVSDNRLWVNVDGVCVLRIGGIPKTPLMADMRKRAR